MRCAYGLRPSPALPHKRERERAHCRNRGFKLTNDASINLFEIQRAK